MFGSSGPKFIINDHIFKMLEFGQEMSQTSFNNNIKSDIKKKKSNRLLFFFNFYILNSKPMPTYFLLSLFLDRP